MAIDKKKLAAITAKIHQMIDEGMVDIPKDYSVDNALRTAWFNLTSQTVKKGDKYVPMLGEVTDESVAEALFEMVTEGTNPKKKQCSFQKTKDRLTYWREYQGDIALAKRYSGVKSVIAKEVYKSTIERKEFITECLTDGREVLVKNNATFEDMDTEIAGAYCVIVDSEGNENLTKMTMKQIITSWEQGYGYKSNGNGVHQKFSDEMVKKTVIRRACKPYINSSSDAVLMAEKKETFVSEAVREDSISLEEPKEQKKLEIPVQVEEKSVESNIEDVTEEPPY